MASDVRTSEFTQLRLAIVLNGGVSLAVWIGGVCDELLRLVVAGRRLSDRESGGRIPAPGPDADPYERLCFEARVFPVVDVMSGASAGGLNSVLLGAALAHGWDDLENLRTTWVGLGQMETLLREPGSGEMPSLLRGDFFRDELEREIRTLLEREYRTPEQRGEPPLRVQLTTTSLRGHTREIGAGKDTLYDTAHDARFVFDEADFDDEDIADSAKRLAVAARASASFPAAFEPVPVEVELFNADGARRLRGALGDREREYFIDGGVLANLPAKQAIDAIIDQKATSRVRRIVALVVPDPVPPGDDDGDDGAPDVLAVVSAAAMSIPRTQSLDGFTQGVKFHNLRAIGTRAARQALLEEIATQDGFAERVLAMAATEFPIYRRRRHAQVMFSLEQRGGLPDDVDLGSIGVDDLRFIPRQLDVPHDGEWCWGSRTARHIAPILHTLLDTMQRLEVPGHYPLWKQYVSENLAESRTGTLHSILARGAAPEDWPARRDEDDPQALREAMNDELRELAQVARQMAEAIDTSNPQNQTLRGFARLMRSGPIRPGPDDASGPEWTARREQALRGLLALEIIEQTFGGFRPVADQVIEVVNVTSRGVVTADRDLRRHRADQKLTGSRLGHFGAFLLPSWRANDWMWGRLDASERIVDLVLRSTADDASYGVAPSANVVADAEVVALKNDVQNRILATELHAIADATESEEGLGRRKLARKAAATQELRFARVGEETVDNMVGTARFTEIVTKASNDTTTMLSQRGPTALRGTATTAGGVTTLLWRINKLARFRNPAVTAFLGAMYALAAVVALGSIDALWSEDGSERSWLPPAIVGVAWLVLLAFTLLGIIVVPSPTVILVGVALVLVVLRAIQETWDCGPDRWCADGPAGVEFSGQRLAWSLAALIGLSLLLWFGRPVGRVARRVVRGARWYGALLTIVAAALFAVYVGTDAIVVWIVALVAAVAFHGVRLFRAALVTESTD